MIRALGDGFLAMLGNGPCPARFPKSGTRKKCHNGADHVKLAGASSPTLRALIWDKEPNLPRRYMRI